MKVLHLPSSVGGNSWGLSQAERQLGIDSKVLIKENNWLDYPNDIDLEINKSSTAVGKFYKQFIAFLQIRNKYDIYHFNSGSSLLHFPSYKINQLDIPFYPKDKKLFVTYNGCDARQKLPTIRRGCVSACSSPDCYNPQCEYGKMDVFRNAAIVKMSQYVQHIWAVNPDLLHFLPDDMSTFLPYTVSNYSEEQHQPTLDETVINIVHAPTNREAKGSAYILAALEKLKEVYAGSVCIHIVENVPHSEAMQIYRNADLIIDQVLIGWYGGFSVECMHMGKPVMCRIEEADLKFIDPEMARDVFDAFINVTPDNIYSKLAECVENRNILKQKAVAAYEYSHKWHNPAYVANITKEAYASY